MTSISDYLWIFPITEHKIFDITVGVWLNIKVNVCGHLPILPINIVIAIHVLCNILYAKYIEFRPFEFSIEMGFGAHGVFNVGR